MEEIVSLMMNGKEKSKKVADDLGPKFREQDALDRAMIANSERPLTMEELSGFGKAKPKPPKGVTIKPFIEFNSKLHKSKGCSVIVGIKGTF